MKKVSRYILVFVIFVLIMSGILVYFSFAKEKINKLNKGKNLLEFIYTLKEGNYILKKGMLYNENNNLISSEYYIDGNGNITKDKYNNVSLVIKLEDSCIYKTSMGEININKNCPEKEELDVTITKNNNKISFTSNIKNISYKVSSNDDFKGSWIPIEGNTHIIDEYNSGENYIWFKTNNGTLSETKTFKIDCLEASSANYDNSVYYCIDSTVYLDGMPWMVIDSNTKTTTLMLVDALEDRLQMCTKELDNNYCYYTKKDSKPYKWSNSYVNYYVNEVFISKLSDETRKLLVETSICDDYETPGCDENQGCGGYLESQIVSNNYTCSTYTKSKVRLLTFDEYSHLANKSQRYTLYISNYWILNGFIKDKASTIEDAGNVFINEDPTSLISVKPVITLKK